MAQAQKSKINRLLVVVKSIDGGTGTFVLNLLKLNKIMPKKSLVIKILVLEGPEFRVLKKNYSAFFTFFRNSNYYPHFYSINFNICFSFFQELIWIKNQIKIFNPNVFIGVDIHANLLISLNTLFSKKKLILTTHNNVISVLKSRSSFFLRIILIKVISFFYKRATYLVCTSKLLSVNLSNILNLKIRPKVVYYGVLAKSNTTKRVDKKYIRLISVGRLVSQKDFSTIIYSFSSVQSKFNNVKLMIIGEGELKNTLMGMSKKLKIDNKIKFIGWKNSVDKYLKASDIFIFSSLIEGFGSVIIEAMSYGLPVISTDTSYGPREILNNGNYGILVPIGNIKKMGKAIIDLITNKNLYARMSKKSIERTKYFTIDKMLNKYKTLITS